MTEEAPNEFESIVLGLVAGWTSLDINRGAPSTGKHTFERLLIKLPNCEPIPRQTLGITLFGVHPSRV